MIRDRMPHDFTAHISSAGKRWLMSVLTTPRTTILGKALRLPLRLIPSSAVVPILQGKLRGKKWVVGSGVHGYWLGTYEVDKLRSFAESVPRGSAVYDIGAHVGYYTLLASELTGPHGSVVAFEPLPRNAAYLRQHLALNGVKNVTLIEAAVGDTDRPVNFKVGRSTTTGTITANGDLTVRGTTLDTQLYEEGMRTPDVIKMDVEGAEFAALRGAARVLSEHHPLIFLASHGPEVHFECCRYLNELGYDLKPVVGEDLAASTEIIARHHSS